MKFFSSFESLPLRVGLLIDDSLDRPDGVQQFVLALGNWLTSQGHTVHYITGSTQRSDLANLHNIGRTVNVRFNGNRLTTPLPASRQKVKELIKKLDLDVLHVMVPYSPLLAGRVISAVPDDSKTAIVGSHMIYPESRLVTVGAAALAAIQKRQSKNSMP